MKIWGHWNHGCSSLERDSIGKPKAGNIVQWMAQVQFLALQKEEEEEEELTEN